jgi:hypothetical protein
MDSADHFKRQVLTSMTQIVEVLESAQDTIFTVVFKKKPKVEDIATLLSNANHADLQ